MSESEEINKLCARVEYAEARVAALQLALDGAMDLHNQAQSDAEALEKSLESKQAEIDYLVGLLNNL